MRSVSSPLLLLIIFSLSLNSCEPIPSPIATPIALTATSALPTLTPVLRTPTITLIPKGKTIIVTSAAASGPGTLRQALLDANLGDIITFDTMVFPPDKPTTIILSTEDQDSALPTISDQGGITIDASNAGVILDGSNIQGDWVNGLEIYSDGNIVQGLQIINFSGSGITVCGGSHNIIGGDPNLGSGPLGQGNLVYNNGIGIDFCGPNTSFNIIRGNLIGIDTSVVESLGNRESGIYIEAGPSQNIIGPDNIISYNKSNGITIASMNNGNTISQNSIHDNGGGIQLLGGGDAEFASLFISDFDLSSGIVMGTACGNCKVEIFSDSNNEGNVFEGQTKADETGFFSFSKDAPLMGPWLTITATDINGNTSPFSTPVSEAIILQEGNNLPRRILQPKLSEELEDNRIGTFTSSLWHPEREPEVYPNMTLDASNIINMGFKRFRLTINSIETVTVDWNKPEFTIEPNHDEFITKLADNGIAITYVLSFWNTERVAQGGKLEVPRFKTEEEIQRYLEYVKFIVHHFKDRIEYYEVWNEPNLTDINYADQQIEVEDYIKLVKRVVPIIRQEYPEAKIVVGGTSSLIDLGSQAYLFDILRSDVMPLVDVVSWHPMYGSSPEYDWHRQYYEKYPYLVQEIKDVASAHGFKGEFVADEIHWPTPAQPEQGWPTYSETKSVKYLMRSIVMHLGMDISVTQLLLVHSPQLYRTNQYLSTIMTGNKTISLPVTIQSEATNIRSYGFSLPNGNNLLALWNDGAAVDYDPGIPSTLIIPGFGNQKAIGIDVLNSFEQELITERENANLVIRNLLVKDYPIIIRLTNVASP